MKNKLFKETRTNPKAGTEGLHFVAVLDDAGETTLHVFNSEDQAGLYHGQLRGYGGIKRIGRLKGGRNLTLGYISDGVTKQFGSEPRMIRHDQSETDPRSYRKNPRNSGDDPSRDEMIEHIQKVYGREADEFDIEEAIYWFASDYHGGQGSNLYSALSTSEYRPGRMSSGPEEGSMGEMIYSDLVDTFSSKKNPVKPRKGESVRDFTSRCMSEEKASFPKTKQRIAVCLSKSRKRNPVYDTGSDE
jgi:hypothetical protein